MAKPSNLRIEDVGAADARADLNDILISIASLQTTDGAGTGYTGEPTTTYPNMLWYDTATNILKMRSEADDAWINLGTLDQSLDTFAANVALASQVEAEAGTNNTKTMTPLRTAQAISALVPAPSTSDVLSATAGAAVGAVGSYAWLATNGEGSGVAGELVAASRLQYAGAASNGISGNGNIVERSGAVSGTWRRMGFQIGYDNRQKGTLYLRVS